MPRDMLVRAIEALGTRTADGSGDAIPFEGFGLDFSMIPLKNTNNAYLIQSTDFFYPLIEDPFKMGKIACANVLSDVYASGVSKIVSIQMMLSTCSRIEDDVLRNEVVRLLIAGFDETASEAGVQVGHVFLGPNPWIIVGGVATAIRRPNDWVLQGDDADIGDVIVLTKPLGTQVAANLHQWMVNDSDQWREIQFFVDREATEKAYIRAVSSMMRLNKHASAIMSKYGAKAATDVTGFGLIGHADNLVKRQKRKGIQFSIRLLPIIRHMRLVNRMANNRFGLLEGRSAETSGGLLIVLPADAANPYCEEVLKIENRRAYIIGVVDRNSDSSTNNVASIIENVDVFEVPEDVNELNV